MTNNSTYTQYEVTFFFGTSRYPACRTSFETRMEAETFLDEKMPILKQSGIFVAGQVDKVSYQGGEIVDEFTMSYWGNGCDELRAGIDVFQLCADYYDSYRENEDAYSFDQYAADHIKHI